MFTGFFGNGKGFLVLGRCLFENENESLKSIIIDGAHARGGDEAGLLDCAVFGNALRRNMCLEKLHLSCCYLSDACCLALITGLLENRSIKEINLGDNAFGDESCAMLSNILRQNPVLEVIDLSTCIAGDDGIRAIVEALHTNRSLKSFVARPEHIDEYGEKVGLAILAMLQMNFSLEYFHVPCSAPLHYEERSTYYLRLNHFGRGGIEQRAAVGESREAAFRALSECALSNDLDCVLYIVRASVQALFPMK